MPGRTTAKFRLTAPPVPESALHQSVAKILGLEIAAAGHISKNGVVWYSIDIANYNGGAPGLRTSRGVIAGIPDVFILWAGRGFFIELKRPVSGALSDPQQLLIPALMSAGGRVGVASTVEGVLQLLDAWGVPRAHNARLMG